MEAPAVGFRDNKQAEEKKRQKQKDQDTRAANLQLQNNIRESKKLRKKKALTAATPQKIDLVVIYNADDRVVESEPRRPQRLQRLQRYLNNYQIETDWIIEL